MLTSRSAIVDYQDCPRRYFYGYRWGGFGVRSKAITLDLEIGSAVHTAMELLLNAHIDRDSLVDNYDEIVDRAVVEGVGYWTTQVATRELYAKGTEGVEFLIFETSALIEILIRIYAMERFPTFIETYRILEVEKEEITSFCAGELILMGKADALLWNRTDKEFVVLSFKTASGFIPITYKRILHDMQGISECYAIRERINKHFRLLTETGELHIKEDIPEWLFEFIETGIITEEVSVNWVQYEFFQKGQRKKDYNTEFYRRQNQILYPYINEANLIAVQEYRAGGTTNSMMESFGVDPEDSFYGSFKWAPGQGRQPKGWSKVCMWERMELKQWLEILKSGRVQPEKGNPFEEVINVPEPIFRDEVEISRWVQQMDYKEGEVMRHLFELENFEREYGKDSAIYTHILDTRFEHRTARCNDYYAGDCPYVQICHAPYISIEMALEEGQFEIRHPHHDLERAEFRRLGYLVDGTTNENTN